MLMEDTDKTHHDFLFSSATKMTFVVESVATICSEDRAHYTRERFRICDRG